MEQAKKASALKAAVAAALAAVAIAVCAALPQSAWAAEAADGEALAEALAGTDSTITLTGDCTGNFTVAAGRTVTIISMVTR